LADNTPHAADSDAAMSELLDFLSRQDDDPTDIAIAVLRAARGAADDLVAIERAAAALLRRRGVTVREIALVAGITERAAMTRYRKVAADAPDRCPPG
jgi:DNA-directed RNA polymerase specialized sigma24 family protein